MVIIQWWNQENGDNDTKNIDTRLMATVSIGIIIFHKIVSSMAIYILERNIFRALLQLFDLLIFQEILYAHEKIVRNMKQSHQGMYNVCIMSVYLIACFVVISMYKYTTFKYYLYRRY